MTAEQPPTQRTPEELLARLIEVLATIVCSLLDAIPMPAALRRRLRDELNLLLADLASIPPALKPGDPRDTSKPRHAKPQNPSGTQTIRRSRPQSPLPSIEPISPDPEPAARPQPNSPIARTSQKLNNPHAWPAITHPPQTQILQKTASPATQTHVQIVTISKRNYPESLVSSAIFVMNASV